MNPEPNVTQTAADAPAASGVPAPAAKPPTANVPADRPARAAVSRMLVLAVGVLAVLALMLNGLMWERQSTLQGQLARQSIDAGANAAEARILSRQTQDQARELAARLAVMEARLGDVSSQRAQLDELMQSLSRTRDENLVVDIEASIRLAQQQSELTGSVEPLLAALRSGEQRLARVRLPRLAPVQRALTHDLARIRATPVADTQTLLKRIDELVRMVDTLPLANAVAMPARTSAATALQPRSEDSVAIWWQRSLQAVRDEFRSLVRVSRIDHPEAVLLSPEQAFFVRENLKLMLINARLGLLARQPEAARADLAKASTTLDKYFDGSADKSRVASGLLKQLGDQMKKLELPRVDDTLAALAAAANGR